MFAAAAAPQVPDVPLVNPPTDTTQCLAWSSKANYIAGGAWDGVDGSKIFAGCGDTTARMWDLASNQMMTVAKHDAPIKGCIWLPVLQCLVTGSWDRTIKFWDCRQQQPALSFPTKERVYAMDAFQECLVVATADRSVSAYSLPGGPRQVYQEAINKLKFSPRTIAVLPTKDGFAVGSVEGRVGIQYFDASKVTDNFSFKCHNDNDNFYCVNGISFHPRFGTFATCGSDARFTFWDKNSRMRLKPFNPVAGPITTCKFNADGTLLAYAVGYDWHKGFQYSTPSTPNSIMIHVTPDAEIQPRPPAAGAARPPNRR